jgi:hypothetical protein
MRFVRYPKECDFCGTYIGRGETAKWTPNGRRKLYCACHADAEIAAHERYVTTS